MLRLRFSTLYLILFALIFVNSYSAKAEDQAAYKIKEAIFLATSLDELLGSATQVNGSEVSKTLQKISQALAYVSLTGDWHAPKVHFSNVMSQAMFGAVHNGSPVQIRVPLRSMIGMLKAFRAVVKGNKEISPNLMYAEITLDHLRAMSNNLQGSKAEYDLEAVRTIIQGGAIWSHNLMHFTGKWFAPHVQMKNLYNNLNGFLKTSAPDKDKARPYVESLIVITEGIRQDIASPDSCPPGLAFVNAAMERLKNVKRLLLQDGAYNSIAVAANLGSADAVMGYADVPSNFFADKVIAGNILKAAKSAAERKQPAAEIMRNLSEVMFKLHNIKEFYVDEE
ncbi:MAG: hypothetical protein AB1403_18605 [Candidatus Riflebacteria bacterium]